MVQGSGFKGLDNSELYRTITRNLIQSRVGLRADRVQVCAITQIPAGTEARPTLKVKNE
jgi:hypothetical protein